MKDVGIIFFSDTKDVIFQNNFLKQAYLLPPTLYYSQDEIVYKHEPWNNENLKQLGPVIYNLLKDNYPKNVGFWGFDDYNSSVNFLSKFCETLDLCDIPLCDQSIFSLMVELYSNNTIINSYNNVNLGTQRISIESGMGDLSIKWLNDPKFRESIRIPNDVKLDWDNIQVVNNINNIPVPVIHQWDRIADSKFKESLREKYTNVTF